MTPQEIQELQGAFAAFKAAHETSLAEVKRYGQALSDTTAKVDQLNTKLDDIEVKINAKAAKEQIDAAMRKINEDLEQFEAKLNRRTANAGDGADDGVKASKLALRAAFFKALRSGYTPEAIKSTSILTPEQQKVLFTGDDTQGGYLAPLEYVQDMISDAVEFSPIRAIAGVRATSRLGVQMPKRTGTASAAWVEELGVRGETVNPSFGMIEIRSHELYAMTKVSRAELDDAVFGLEGFLRAEFAEQFGVLEGSAFVLGNGVGKPEGFLANSSVGEVNSGHASLITGDGLIGLYYEVKEQYVNNSTFVLSRSTLKTIRLLKDGQGNYLWAAGIKTDGRPATILDRPYVTAIDMPPIAPGNYPVVFGDFRRAYLILDRIAMEIMVDPYKSKETGMIEFSARKRVGGQVVLPEALKKLKIAA